MFNQFAFVRKIYRIKINIILRSYKEVFSFFLKSLWQLKPVSPRSRISSEAKDTEANAVKKNKQNTNRIIFIEFS